ncbi:MAG: hypothetical protein MJK13_06925 [Pseudomonadales bacterium]|nr:hypothetical protein [Pseudomonadales bacterium]
MYKSARLAEFSGWIADILDVMQTAERGKVNSEVKAVVSRLCASYPAYP